MDVIVRKKTKMKKLLIAFGILTISILSCKSPTCMSRVEALSYWIADASHYDCTHPERLISSFSKVCRDSNESDNPAGFLGSVLCTVCLDIPLARLNGIFEDAGCSKVLINKSAKDTLISTCKMILPFASYQTKRR